MVSTTPTLQSTKGSARRQSRRASQLAKLAVSEDADKLSQFADEPAVDVGASKQELDAVVSEGANISTTGEVLELQTFAASETETDHELPIVADNSVAEATTPTRKDIDESDVLVDGDRAQQTAAASVMEGGMESIASDEGIEQVETPARKSIHEADAVRGTDMVSTTPTLQSTQGSARRQSGRASQPIKLVALEFCGGMPLVADEPPVEVDVTKKEDNEIIFDSANIATIGDTLETLADEIAEETAIDLAINAEVDVPSMAQDATEAVLDKKKVALELDQAEDTKENDQVVEVAAEINDSHGADTVEYADVAHTDEETVDILQPVPASKQADVGQHAEVHEEDVLMFENHDEELQIAPSSAMKQAESEQVDSDDDMISAADEIAAPEIFKAKRGRPLKKSVDKQVAQPEKPKRGSKKAMNDEAVAVFAQESEKHSENSVDNTSDLPKRSGRSTRAHDQLEMVESNVDIPQAETTFAEPTKKTGRTKDSIPSESVNSSATIAKKKGAKSTSSKQSAADITHVELEVIEESAVVIKKAGRSKKARVAKDVPAESANVAEVEMKAVENSADVTKKAAPAKKSHSAEVVGQESAAEIKDGTEDEAEAVVKIATVTKKTSRTKKSQPVKSAPAPSETAGESDIANEVEAVEKIAAVTKKAARAKKSQPAKEIVAAEIEIESDDEAEAVEKVLAVTKKAGRSKKAHPANVVPTETVEETEMNYEPEVAEKVAVTKKAARTKKTQPAIPVAEESAVQSEAGMKNEEKDVLVAKKPGRGRKSHASKAVSAEPVAAVATADTDVEDKPAAKKGRSKKSKSADVADLETENEPVLAKPKPLGSKKTTAVISGEALIEPVKAPKKGRRALAARNEQSEDESEQFGQKTEPEAPAIRRARSTRARN